MTDSYHTVIDWYFWACIVVFTALLTNKRRITSAINSCNFSSAINPKNHEKPIQKYMHKLQCANFSNFSLSECFSKMNHGKPHLNRFYIIYVTKVNLVCPRIFLFWPWDSVLNRNVFLQTHRITKVKSQLVRSPGKLYCEILTFRLHLEPLSKSLQRVPFIGEIDF